MASEFKDAHSDALATLSIDRSLKPTEKAGSPFWRRFFYAVGMMIALAAGIGLSVRMGWLRVESWQTYFSIPDAIKSRPEVSVVKPVIERGRAADATVVATGYLESRRQAKIGARAVGRVQAVNVEEGTRVKKDDILAILEHADLDASLAATQANLERARAAVEEQRVIIQQNEREYKRAAGLSSTRSISKTELDKAQFDYESSLARLKSMQAEVLLAEARLQEAQQIKENMFIRAPFDGTVISKDAEVGESIMPGGMGEASGRGSAVTIADLQHLEVDCDVKEDFINRVDVGQSAEVSVDAVPNHRYKGTVRKIIPMGDRARATIKVKVSIDDVDERLFPNMSSTVYFLPSQSQQVSDEKPRLFCPQEAIRQDDQGDFVWIADRNDHAQMVRIEVGSTRDGRTEVFQGLQGDESIIMNPPDLYSDQALKVIRQ